MLSDIVKKAKKNEKEVDNIQYYKDEIEVMKESEIKLVRKNERN